MGAVTTGILVGATVLGAGATAYSAQRQNVASRRAETRAKGMANEERQRQREQEAIIAREEEKTMKRQAGALRATAGKRAGRRSLVTGPETGLAQSETLG